MTDYNTKKDIGDFLYYRFRFKNQPIDKSRIFFPFQAEPGTVSNTTNVFYHPWQAPKYTEEQLKTEPLPSFTPKCTCGVKFTGGIHSDWCDTHKSCFEANEDEFPF